MRLALVLLVLAIGCTPKVEVAPPDLRVRHRSGYKAPEDRPQAE